MKKQNALFLGGTKGLGLELARIARSEYASVTVVGRNPQACSLVKSGAARGITHDLESDAAIPSSVLTCEECHDLIIWTAGVYQEGRILDLSPEKIRRICRNHVEGPMRFLIPVLRRNRETRTPCFLVIIASSSSYRIRENEGLYGPQKAAKAHIARILGRELPTDIPGSKVLLANPGGMATPFWEGRNRDVSAFMSPVAVADMLWREIKYLEGEVETFREIHIVRQADHTPIVEYGARTPE